MRNLQSILVLLLSLLAIGMAWLYFSRCGSSPDSNSKGYIRQLERENKRLEERLHHFKQEYQSIQQKDSIQSRRIDSLLTHVSHKTDSLRSVVRRYRSRIGKMLKNDWENLPEEQKQHFINESLQYLKAHDTIM